jgi:hypothetical protein
VPPVARGTSTLTLPKAKVLQAPCASPSRRALPSPLPWLLPSFFAARI